MKTINTINTSIKGLWLEADILSIEELDITNSVLLQEIINLSKLKDGCFASNNHFAALLKINKSYASKRISQLAKLGFITTKNIFKNKNCIGRIITPNFEKIKSTSKIELPVEMVIEKIDNPTAAAQVEIIVEENNIPTSAAPVEIIEELPVEFELEIKEPVIIENNIPTSAVVEEQLEEPVIIENNISTEKQAEKMLSNFEKFKIEEEEKENIERVREEEKQQELLIENLKQKTMQSKLVEDIAKQKEKINNLKETGKTNKEMLDQLFAHTLQNWIEEYEFLGNSMFCKQYKNLITEDIKLLINYFERDLMFERYVFTTEQFN